MSSGRGVELGEHDHEGRCVLAPVRARGVGVDEVQHDGDVGTGVLDLGVTLVEHDLTQAVGEPPHRSPRGSPLHANVLGMTARSIDNADPGGVGHPEPFDRGSRQKALRLVGRPLVFRRPSHR